MSCFQAFEAPELICFVKLFDDNEVKILAGTDTPIGYLTPGFSLHKELELLVEAGLSAKAALRAATLSPAEFFNLESTMGTLDEGKVADILILNQNPIENIQHTQDIFRVIVKGSTAWYFYVAFGSVWARPLAIVFVLSISLAFRMSCSLIWNANAFFCS